MLATTPLSVSELSGEVVMSAGADSFSVIAAMAKQVPVNVQLVAAGFGVLMQVNRGASVSTAFDFLKGRETGGHRAGFRHGITLAQNSRGKTKVRYLRRRFLIRLPPDAAW